MGGSSSQAPDPEPALDATVQAVTEVLSSVAKGEYGVRAERTYNGDPLDVLAFLVNATAEEVGALVCELERERESVRRARDQLLLATKLAALGELAAGVAHELNQPLTAMTMVTDLLRNCPDERVGQRQHDLDLLAEATRRMSRIVDGVRTFGRVASFVRQRHPGAAVVVTSGFAEADDERAIAEVHAVLLHKPFESAGLCEAVAAAQRLAAAG